MVEDEKGPSKAWPTEPHIEMGADQSGGGEEDQPGEEPTAGGRRDA